MSQQINPSDTLNEFDKPPLPSSLNVLTILTFIGSGIGAISSIYSFISAKKSYDTMKETIESGQMDKAPKIFKSMMSPDMLNVYQKMYENKLPILILSLVAIALCVYGAMEMRKLKKQGYIFYVAGELLPLVSAFIFIGAAAFSGFGMLMVLIPAIFIILYTVNRKHLVN